MDYTELPRELVYKDRKSLEEFVEEDESMSLVIDNMLSNQWFLSSNSIDRALQYVNTAYYLCTLILLSGRHSDWYFRKYCEIAFCGNNQNKVNQAFTLSLVYIFLTHTYFEIPNMKIVTKLSDELNSAIRFLQKGDPFLLDYYYSDAYKDLKKGLPDDWTTAADFEPRKIDNDIYHDVDGPGSPWCKLTNYYRREEIEKIVKALGRDASEKHILVDLIRRDAERFYGSDGPCFIQDVTPRLAVINNWIDSEYGKPADATTNELEEQPQPSVGVTEMEARISELESENNRLKQEREKLDNELQKTKHDLQEADKALAAITSVNDEVSVHSISRKDYKFTNNIRYELFLRLLEKAGCEPGVQANQTMIGELWEALTKQSSEKCRQYMPQRAYQTQETIKHIPGINSLLKSMGINIDL